MDLSLAPCPLSLLGCGGGGGGGGGELEGTKDGADLCTVRVSRLAGHHAN